MRKVLPALNPLSWTTLGTNERMHILLYSTMILCVQVLQPCPTLHVKPDCLSVSHRVFSASHRLQNSGLSIRRLARGCTRLTSHAQSGLYLLEKVDRCFRPSVPDKRKRQCGREAVLSFLLPSPPAMLTSRVEIGDPCRAGLRGRPDSHPPCQLHLPRVCNPCSFSRNTVPIQAGYHNGTMYNMQHREQISPSFVQAEKDSAMLATRTCTVLGGKWQV